MSVLPNAIKEDIKPLVKGMRNMKLLLESDGGTSYAVEFDKLSTSELYTPYATVDSEDGKISILALESDEMIKELILFGEDDEAAFLIGVTGKMNKENFLREIENTRRRSKGD